MKQGIRRGVQRTGVVLTTAAVGVAATAVPALAASSVGWYNFPQVSSEDRIDVRTVPSAVAAGNIRICLETASYVTWWKGLVLRDWNYGVLQELGAEGGSDRVCTERRISDIRQLEFWKAKLFGVHTHMYTMSYSTLSQRSGSEVTFRWVQD